MLTSVRNKRGTQASELRKRATKELGITGIPKVAAEVSNWLTANEDKLQSTDLKKIITSYYGERATSSDNSFGILVLSRFIDGKHLDEKEKEANTEEYKEKKEQLKARTSKRAQKPTSQVDDQSNREEQECGAVSESNDQ